MISLCEEIQEDRKLQEARSGKKRSADPSRNSTRAKRRKVEEEEIVEKARYVCGN
jgi:hypothetical protein